MCKEQKTAPFGHISNLNKHLREDHPEDLNLKEWFDKYSSENNKKGTIVSDEEFNFIKFVLTANLNTKNIKNIYLKNLIKDKIQLHENQTLEDKMKEIKLKHFEIIDKELDKSLSISLIFNLWTRDKKHILAISASYLNAYYINNVITLDIEIKNDRNTIQFWINATIKKFLEGKTFKFKKDLIKGKLFNI